MSRLRDFVKRVMERIPAGGSDGSASPATKRWQGLPVSLEDLSRAVNRARTDGFNDGYAKGLDDGRCATCGESMTYVDSPTGSWWSHLKHPSDGHDAVEAAEAPMKHVIVTRYDFALAVNRAWKDGYDEGSAQRDGSEKPVDFCAGDNSCRTAIHCACGSDDDCAGEVGRS